jgi:F-type H+-transporting ATPase subunit alpha
LFYSGVRPAVNVGLSVSRVGGSAQIKAMRQVAGRLRLDLAQYNELAAFAQFGSELDKASQNQLARGERLVEMLKQDQFQPMPAEEQVAIIFAGINGFLDDLPVPAVRRFEKELLAWMRSSRADVLKTIREKGQIEDDLKAKLTDSIQTFKGQFKA